MKAFVCSFLIFTSLQANEFDKKLPCPSCAETEQEQISSYHCRQQVRKVTKDLKYLVEKMVADTVPGFFDKIKTFRRLNPYIDQLSRQGLSCCQNNETEKPCTEPLVEQFNLWNSEGLFSEPRE